MRCHVCGAKIRDVLGGSSDLPLVMDGWAWTVATDGSLDIVTCADCTKLMRPLVGSKPGQEPEYGNQVVWAVRYLVGQRFDAARAAGGGALWRWCDEAVTKPDYDARRSLVGGLYGLDSEPLTQSSARLSGGTGSGRLNWKPRTSETDWAKEEKCVRCGDLAITRYSKTALVPFCWRCVAVADASTLPENEKEAVVCKVGAGDCYAWQRLVETQPEYLAWERSDALRMLARVVSDQPRESAWERRRRRLRKHPEEHLVKVLGMADMFEPKMR